MGKMSVANIFNFCEDIQEKNDIISLYTSLDPHTAEIQTKKQMGKDAKMLLPDQFQKDCHHLQK